MFTHFARYCVIESIKDADSSLDQEVSARIKDWINMSSENKIKAKTFMIQIGFWKLWVESFAQNLAM